jgi:hypothetical protein
MKNEQMRQGGATDFDALYPIYMAENVNPYFGFEIMSKESFKPIFEEFTASGQLYVYEVDHVIVATCIVYQKKDVRNM